MLLDFDQDNLSAIVSHIDIITFMYLFSTCKVLFNQRKEYTKFLKILDIYKQYDSKNNLFNILLIIRKFDNSNAILSS